MCCCGPLRPGSSPDVLRSILWRLLFANAPPLSVNMTRFGKIHLLVTVRKQVKEWLIVNRMSKRSKSKVLKGSDEDVATGVRQDNETLRESVEWKGSHDRS